MLQHPATAVQVHMQHMIVNTPMPQNMWSLPLVSTSSKNVWHAWVHNLHHIQTVLYRTLQPIFRCSSLQIAALFIHNTNTHHLPTLTNLTTSCLLQFHSLAALKICPDTQAVMPMLNRLHVHTLQMPVPSDWWHSSVWIPHASIHLATGLPPSTSFLSLPPCQYSYNTLSPARQSFMTPISFTHTLCWHRDKTCTAPSSIAWHNSMNATASPWDGCLYK